MPPGRPIHNIQHSARRRSTSACGGPACPRNDCNYKGGGVEVPDQVNAMRECGPAQPWTDRQSLLWVISGCAGQTAARQVNPNKRTPELEQTYLGIRHPLDNVFAYSVTVLRSSAANAAADCAVSAE